jgi:hypothetical protein
VDLRRQWNQWGDPYLQEIGPLTTESPSFPSLGLELELELELELSPLIS